MEREAPLSRRGVAVPYSRVASPSISNALLGGRDDRESRAPSPAVLLSGVTRVFGLSPALVRADLRVERGETLLIRGPNGAGKTTLLRLIATAITPTYGSGSVLGFDLTHERDEIRRRTELLGHRTRLYEDLTGTENMRFVCRLFDVDPEGVAEALAQVGLTDAAAERVRAYSQGMRQRLALARTLLRRPELLLLDEPYAGLDAEAKSLVDDVVGKAPAQGCTVILATHDPSRGATATRTLLMEGGRLVGSARMNLLQGSAAIAAKDLRIEVRARHGAAVVLPFASTLLVAFGLSLGPGRTLLQQTAPGLLWLAVLFASVLAFRRTYEIEGDDGALEGLLLAPIDKASVFLGKAAAVAVQLLALEVVVVVLVSALFGLSLTRHPGALAAAFVLGTVGLSAVGSLFGVLAELPRAREAVFPLLVLPLTTPVIVSAVKATALATQGPSGEAASWLGLLLAFDLVFLAAGTLVFAYLMED